MRHKIDARTKNAVVIKPFPTTTVVEVKRPSSDEVAEDLNKLWLIVRYMTVENRTNEFKI